MQRESLSNGIGDRQNEKRQETARHITRCLWEAMLPQIRLRRTSQTPGTLSEMVLYVWRG